MDVSFPKDANGSRLKRSLSMEDIDISDSDIEPFENWRNKGKPQVISKNKKKIRRAKHSILSKQDLTYFYNDIPLLENGQTTKNIVTERTCAFDSIYVIFGVAAIDYNCIEIVSTETSKFSQFLSETVTKQNKKQTKLYKLRNEILKSVFSRESYKDSKNLTRNDQLTHIDCLTGLGGFFSQLVYDGNEQLCSYTINARCRDCHEKKKILRPLVPLLIDMEQPIPLHDIQSRIIPYDRNIRCQKCQIHMKCDRAMNKIIALEVEPTNPQHTTLYKLSSIQNEILLENKSYRLFGTIEYNALAHHFIAHIKRKNDVWETYDDLDAKKATKNSKTATKIFLCFST